MYNYIPTFIYGALLLQWASFVIFTSCSRFININMYIVLFELYIAITTANIIIIIFNYQLLLTEDRIGLILLSMLILSIIPIVVLLSNTQRKLHVDTIIVYEIV